jgi:hypothetical protein
MPSGGIYSKFIVRLHRFAAAFFIAVFFLVSNSIPVYALSSGGIGGYPAHTDPGIQYSDSWFIYNLDLGESKEDAILLTNHSDAQETIKIYAVDSVATGDGNFSLKSELDPRTGVGSWITLRQNLITLAPGAEQEVPFTITIPEVIDVGEHSGGIILEKTKTADAAIGQNSASIVTRVGIRVYENVPGELIRKVEISDFNVTRQTPKDKKPFYRIDLGVVNKSNVSLNARATVHITGWGKTKYFPKSHFKDGLYLDYTDLYTFFGGETLTGDWQLLRDKKVSTNWEWPEPAFGQYTFQADITYDGTNGPETVSTKTVTITVIPWTLIIWIAILIALCIGYVLVKKMLKSGRGWQKYTVKAGEQLTDIAVNAGISWKKLAAVNKIKAPYLVRSGQTVLVPRMLADTAPSVRQTAPVKKTLQKKKATTPPRLAGAVTVNVPIRKNVRKVSSKKKSDSPTPAL